MRKSCQIILCFLVAFSPILSQEKKDSLLYKNEVGLDIAPVFKIGNNSGRFLVRVIYKRALKKNIFIRLQHTNINYRREIFAPAHTSKYQGMHSVEYFYVKTIRLPEYHFDLGIERRWGGKSLKYFFGSDIGYYKARTIYTSYTGNTPRYLFNDSMPVYRNHKDRTVAEHDVTVRTFRLSPFIGAQFIFSKHWFFTAQFSYEQQFQFFEFKNFDLDYPQIDPHTTQQSIPRLRWSHVIGRFYINYRF